MKTNLAIVIPCYNPKSEWEKELLKNYKRFTHHVSENFNVQLILINDGSTKNISQNNIDFILTQIPNLVYINSPENTGKGYALRTAIKDISKGLIIYTDVDWPYKLENILEMVSLLNSGNYDVVVGVRTKHYFKKLPFMRRVLSLVLRFANSLFFPKLYVKDTQSGLKGFNQKGKDLFLNTKINGFLFEPEFIRSCSKENLKMQKIVLQLKNGITFSSIKFSVIKNEAVNFLKLLK